jgi:hypothetical protein
VKLTSPSLAGLDTDKIPAWAKNLQSLPEVRGRIFVAGEVVHRDSGFVTRLSFSRACWRVCWSAQSLSSS